MDVLALLSGITQAVTAYQVAADAMDKAKIAAATNELHIQLTHLGAQLIAMQNERLQAAERESTLLGENHDLRNRVRELETKASERERYELVDVHMGAFAYRLKASSANGEPVHYLCQGCLDNKAMKVVIQRHSSLNKDAICPACKTEYWFNWFRRGPATG